MAAKQQRQNATARVLLSLRKTIHSQIFKLTLFSILYGLILINWIDLFNPSSRMPAYDLWLISMYFAPYVLVVIYQGLGSWYFALALGLITSLMNDLFYYPIGDLLFGFHENLIQWYQSQLGFDGSRTVLHFYAGFSGVPISSTLMGAFIYTRIAIVLLIFRHWSHRERGLIKASSV